MTAIAKKWFRDIAGLSLLLLLGGCCSHSPGQYNVSIGMGPSLRGDTVMVDIVGVNDSEYDKWANYSMTQYWTAADPLRADAVKYTLLFDAKSATTQVFKQDNPIWQKWRQVHARRLFILANLPGVFEDQPGNQDPRRVILPLDQCRWRLSWFSSVDPIKIQAQSSGLDVLTPPQPKKK
jgi:hypothetical protein